MRKWILLASTGLFFLNAGCSQLSTMPAPSFWPFHTDRSDDLKRYGPTLDQREEATLSLGRRAESMAPEEYARLAHELSVGVENEPNSRLRAAAVRALGHFDTPDTIAALKIAMHDGDSRVRIAACESWQTLKSADSTAALAELIGGDTNVDVRLAATRALGDFATSRAVIESLELGLDDPDPAIQHETVLSLKKVTGKDYGGDLAAWRTFIAGGEPIVAPTPSLADRLMGWVR